MNEDIQSEEKKTEPVLCNALFPLGANKSAWTCHSLHYSLFSIAPFPSKSRAGSDMINGVQVACKRDY